MINFFLSCNKYLKDIKSKKPPIQSLQDREKKGEILKIQLRPWLKIEFPVNGISFGFNDIHNFVIIYFQLQNFPAKYLSFLEMPRHHHEDRQ